MHIKNSHTHLATIYKSHLLSLTIAHPQLLINFISQMSSARRFSYHKLKQDHQNDDHQVSASAVEAMLESAARGLMRARTRLRRVPVRRRLMVRGFGVIRLRRYLRSRKVRLVKKVKGSWEKVVRRVRESQAHFGDLFAGNYLLLQVNPTPLIKGGGERLGFVGDSKNPMYNYTSARQLRSAPAS